MMPLRDDRGDAVARLLGRGKTDQQRARGLGLLQDAHRDLGDHAEQPLGAGHQAQQVVAALIEMLAAETHDVAVRQHHLEAENVVGGEPVLQAVHAARVLGDVAADRARDLAGWIGRVVEAFVLDRIGDAEIGDARLGDHAAVLEVDLQDAIELAQAQHDAVGERQGATRERGSRAPRHDLDPLRIAQLQDRGDLRRGARQDHRHRHRAIGGQAIALVGAQLVLIGDHALARNDRAQSRHDRIALGERRLIGFGHAHGGSPTTSNMAASRAARQTDPRRSGAAAIS